MSQRNGSANENGKAFPFQLQRRSKSVSEDKLHNPSKQAKDSNLRFEFGIWDLNFGILN